MVASNPSSKQSLLPAQLLRQIEQNSPFRNSMKLAHDTSSHHSRGRSLDACVKKPGLNLSEISGMDSNIPRDTIG